MSFDIYIYKEEEKGALLQHCRNKLSMQQSFQQNNFMLHHKSSLILNM
ncbi:MAG: hypothetical protein K6253_01255 [Candidatus Liberibacter asiaticus]|nr:hypothetical protein [Candidatus Liberibacter asiaticus]